MIELGQYNHLKIARIVEPGGILIDDEENEVLLPGKYLAEGDKEEDELKVFIYKDSEDRIVATTEDPLVKLHEFGFLKVVDVNNMGAFLNWGLEKDLLVPFREQLGKMEVGRSYMVYVYKDDKTQRLAGTAKVNKHYNKDTSELNEGDQVDILIGKQGDLGLEVIVNNAFPGLIFKNEIFQDVLPGERTIGFIKKIRDDHKLDISLRKTGLENLDDGSQAIMDELERAEGFLPLHDKSSPEEIQIQFQMSKKNFKRSLGILYKKRLVSLEKDGIRLISK